MKKVFVTVCSIFLILACLFGLFACVTGMKDNLNIKDYKTIDGEEAEAGVATARDAVKQLSENAELYLSSVPTYEAGLIAYSEGQATLSDGYSQYYAGKKTLEEGKAMLAANTQAYNEGKETLSKIEPLMPLVDAYVSFRDKSVSSIQGFTDAQAWFASKVRPLAANLGLEVPDDVVDFPAYIQTMVTEGKASIKLYEDSQQQLIDGEKKLKEAAAQLADGEAQLKDADAQLKDGDATLAMFESGEAQLAAGLEQLLAGMTEVYTRDGKEVVTSLKALLGDDFSYWAKDEKGEIIVERGCQFLDFDACNKLLDEAEHYLELSGADTTGEVVGRVVMDGLMGLASVLGLIAGLVGLFGVKKNGFVAGVVAAVCAIAGNIAGLIIGYANLAYMPETIVDGVETYTYAGDVQMAAIILLAVIAVVFVVATGMARKAAKAKSVEAPAVSDDKLAELEKENESLKEMVAKLAEEATVKE